MVVQRAAHWQAHQGAVYSLDILPNGELVSGGGDGLVIRWDLKSQQPIRKWGPFSGAPFVVRSVGTEIYAGLFRRGLVVLDAKAPQLIAYWDKRVSVFAISQPVGPHLWIGMSQGYLMQWNLESHEPAAIYQVGNHSWRSVEVVNDTIWAGNSQGELLIINQNGKPLFLGRIHQKAIFAFHATPGFVASASHDRQIQLWDPHFESAPKLTKQLQGHTRGVLTVTQWQKWLISGSQDKSIKIWDTTSGKAIRTIHPIFSSSAHQYAINALASTQHFFVAGSEDRSISLWIADDETTP